MRRMIIAGAVLACAGLLYATELTGADVLKNVDDVLYAPKDKDMKVRFVLIDKNGKESNIELITQEKGSDRRLMKFTAPADQKGIGFLSLPNDVMYVYLPAFGKTRRIASNVKNQKFAGTDLTYENLEAKRYSEGWDAKIVPQSDTTICRLHLTSKPGTRSQSAQLYVNVRKEGFYPVRIEYYDYSGVHYKTMERRKIEKIGKYWESRETLVEDLKSKHTTKMILLDVKFDTGIPDDHFTERYLMR